jgi:homoserine kinase
MPGLLSLTLSGAGPSVLALASDEAGACAAIGEAMRVAFAREGIAADILTLPISAQGARVVSMETCST